MTAAALTAHTWLKFASVAMPRAGWQFGQRKPELNENCIIKLLRLFNYRRAPNCIPITFSRNVELPRKTILRWTNYFMRRTRQSKFRKQIYIYIFFILYRRLGPAQPPTTPFARRACHSHPRGDEIIRLEEEKAMPKMGARARTAQIIIFNVAI